MQARMHMHTHTCTHTQTDTHTHTHTSRAFSVCVWVFLLVRNISLECIMYVMVRRGRTESAEILSAGTK